MKDVIDHSEPGKRLVRPALLKGWRRTCPQCGGGALFDGYLTVREGCDICGEEFHHHRADDAPSWATMLIVGHLIAPMMIAAYEMFDLPTWAHAVIWPVVAMTGVIVLLPRVKGAIVAFQWAHRMHGFDKDHPDPDAA